MLTIADSSYIHAGSITSRGLPRFHRSTTTFRNAGAIQASLRARKGESGSIVGSGCAASASEATAKSLAEAVERYSLAPHSSQVFETHSSRSLGRVGLDLKTLPKLSASELSADGCPINLPSPDQPIRWMDGLNLTNGHDCKLPAVMVYSHAGFASDAERFWLPTSTGAAAQRTYPAAVYSGLREVIERDAVSIVWQQQMPLSEIILDQVPEELGSILEQLRASSRFLEYRFFNAMSTIGLPTIYAVQIARCSKRVHTLVAAATGSTWSEAIEKSIWDLTILREGFAQEVSIPNDVSRFSDVMHGATYMARRESFEGFRFLLASTTPKSSLSKLTQAQPVTLEDLLETFKRRGSDIYIADLTTRESLRFGLVVVRVIVPELQPLSFYHRCQFRGHPRLYVAPSEFGFGSHHEGELNLRPQPFC